MTTAIIATTLFAAAVLYENDFATRRSEELPRSVWATYEYDKGGPVAFDYYGDRYDVVANNKFNKYTGMYPYSPEDVPYSQQDGWIKKWQGINNRNTNIGRTSITDEEDPALVFSMKDIVLGGSDILATNQTTYVFHPLRNVFTNGIIRVQFDVRQPNSASNKSKISWFRLVTENDMKNDNTSLAQFPIELGLHAEKLSAAWSPSANEERQLYNLADATPFHWYRYVVMCDLGAEKSSVEVYDLGLSRISMDETPSSAAIASRSNCCFRKHLDSSTGGINGIGIRFSKTDTSSFYGEEGFNADAAYMYDNIKVSWMAPGASSFTDCYRNDFAKSMRRTIDGSDELVHNYVQTESDETATFIYGNELVRDLSKRNGTDKPYLPGAYGTQNTPQTPGVDGWRIGGRQGFVNPIGLTTNGTNRIGFIPGSCQCIQPMCEDITNGLVKMEMDMRMPSGWNNANGHTTLILTSNKGYNEANAFNWYTYVRLGLSSANCYGGSAANPATSYSVTYSTETVITNTNPSWSSEFKALEWYRLQLFLDMDKTNYWFYVYDLGASSPATPDAFDSSDIANALVAGPTNKFYQQAYTNGKFGHGIGAYGVLNWQGSSAANQAMYFDNVRLWKGDGNGGWDLVFKNDFSTTVRNFKRKSLNLQKSNYVDRPEYAEDGVLLSYVNPVRIAGGNPALYSGDNTFSIIHPIGRIVKSGMLYAQYDVRLPVFWPSSPNYFRFQLGGGVIASASTWKTPAYRSGTHRVIRAEFQMGAANSTTGVKDQTTIAVQNGTGAGGASTLSQSIGNSCVGHWVRMKIEANMGKKSYSISAYDMGTAQPTLATADGTLLKSWENLQFFFNEPISHFHITTGTTPSFAPWRSDMPGSLLMDNIRISYDSPGSLFSIR